MDPRRSLDAQLMQRQNLGAAPVAQAPQQQPQQPDRLKAVLDQVAKNILGVSLTEAEGMSPDDRDRLGITEDKIRNVYRLAGGITDQSQ